MNFVRHKIFKKIFPKFLESLGVKLNKICLIISAEYCPFAKVNVRKFFNIYNSQKLMQNLKLLRVGWFMKVSAYQSLFT